MRNISFLLQKFGFVFLFLLLEGVAFVLSLRESNFRKVFFVNATTGVTGRIYEGYSDFTQYFYLSRENKLLVEENARLRGMLEESARKYYSPFIERHDTASEQAFTYYPCRVINNTTTKTQNYFTIDAGSEQGIEPDMGIISPQGIAGVVKGVSPNFSVCISVLNVKLPVSVQMRRSKDSGILLWDGKSSVYSMVNNIPSHVKVNPGDTVETSGYSSIFPEGVMVGTVIGASIDPDNGYYVILVHLSTSFNAMRQVYAIDYKFKREQKAIEDSLAVDVNLNVNE